MGKAEREGKGRSGLAVPVEGCGRFQFPQAVADEREDAMQGPLLLFQASDIDAQAGIDLVHGSPDRLRRSGRGKLPVDVRQMGLKLGAGRGQG